jgi:cobalt-zinc-cadmium resistance protein CzcA
MLLDMVQCVTMMKVKYAGAIVMMLKGANSSDVIIDVKDRIEQIKKTLPRRC